MLSAIVLAAALSADHAAAPKRALNLPPAADLHYAIRAKQRGFSLSGEAFIQWRNGEDQYSVTAETRASFLGKILEGRSEGAIDAFGLAPRELTEKRFRKDPYTTTFDRAAKSIRFTEAKTTYAIKGGEQDRTSVTWALIGAARAAPDKFIPGSE